MWSILSSEFGVKFEKKDETSNIGDYEYAKLKNRGNHAHKSNVSA